MNKFYTLLAATFLLTNCVSLAVDPSEIAGLSSGNPYSKQSFKDGTYRFSKIDALGFGRGATWGAKLDRFFARGDYQKVIDILSEKDSGSDMDYYYLGIIAENRGYFIAAREYFQQAKALYDSGNNLASMCLLDEENIKNPPKYGFFSDDIDWNMIFINPQPCYGMNFNEVINSSIDRANKKIDDSYEELNLEYDDGSIYIGASNSNDEPNGYGELFYSNGDVYRGNFKNFLPDGKGSLVMNNGWLFDGLFKNGLPKGGHLSNVNDLFYRGMQFKNGEFHYSDGDKLGQKSLDNNWWFAETVGGAFMNATRQYVGMYLQAELTKELTKQRSVSTHCRNRVRLKGMNVVKERKCYETVRVTWQEPIFIPGITF